MASSNNQLRQSSDELPRRKYLAGLALASGAGLAGCSSNDGNQQGNGNGELGERVPTITMQVWSDLGGTTTTLEVMAEVMQSAFDELGVESEVETKTLLASIETVFNDQRVCEYLPAHHSTDPGRLDPQEMTWRFNLTWAGANNLSNINNYANCEYSLAAKQQAQTTDTEKRQEYVTEAHSIMSEDVGSIPLAKIVTFGAVLDSQVEPAGIGEAGIMYTNPFFVLKSNATGDNTLKLNGTEALLTGREMYVDMTDPDAILSWTNYVYSPLVSYNENFQLENVLADNIDVSEDGTTITVTLNDATFHNGDPVTSEDVKWTYQWLSDNYEAFKKVQSVPYESIDTPDDKTTVFNLETQYPSLMTATFPRWGVLPKDIWVDAGAEENPGNVEIDEHIGAGPYKVSDISDSGMLLEPHDGNPKFSPEANLSIPIFQGVESAFRAFQNEEINILATVSSTIYEEIDNNMDGATAIASPSYLPKVIYPQMSFGPAMFPEFSHALSRALDRREYNQVALNGHSEPILYSCPLPDSHPFYPGDDNLKKIADQPTPDVERAKGILEDNGWGWDDQGRLRLPADADLSPKWPKDSEPTAHPDEFPCVDELTN